MKFKVKQQQDKTIVQALIFKNEELVERELNTEFPASYIEKKIVYLSLYH